MAEDFTLGTVTGEISFDLPASELAKLDAVDEVAERVSKNMKSVGNSFSTSFNLPDMGVPAGAPGGGGAGPGGKGFFDLPEKEKQKLGVLGKEAPKFTKLFNAFGKGGAAMIAGFSAVALLFGAGNGFKEVFGALWDILGLVSDLIFVQLFPIIKPLLEAFVEFGKHLIAHANEPGGIFGAILDPELWMPIWRALGEFIGRLAGELVIALSNPTTWAGITAVLMSIIPAFVLGIIEGILGAIWDSMKTRFDALLNGDFLTAAIGTLGADIVKNIAESAVNLGTSIATSFIQGVKDFFASWVPTISIHVPSPGEVASGAGNLLQNGYNAITPSWMPGHG